MRVVATGPSGPAAELDPLREAGHEVVIGRPLDQPGRPAFTEPELIALCRDADVVLASHLERTVDPERLILTPHNVGHSEAGRRANLKLAMEQILAVGRSEPPAHLVNPGAVPAWRSR